MRNNLLTKNEFSAGKLHTLKETYLRSIKPAVTGKTGNCEMIVHWLFQYEKNRGTTQNK